MAEKKIPQIYKTLSPMIDEAPLAFAWLDKNGNIDYLNQSFQDLFGYTLQDIPTLEDWFLRAFPDAVYRQTVKERHASIFAELGKGKRIKPHEVSVTCKDGSKRQVAIEGVILAGRILAIFSDLSESKRKEERFRAVADYTYDWEIWTAPDGKLLWVNPAVEVLTGYSIQEYFELPDRWNTIIFEEDRERILPLIRNGLRDQLTAHNIEYRIRRKDGSIRWVGVSFQPIYGNDGEYLGLRSSIRDIEARKQVELALRESESLNRAIIAEAHEGIVVFDRALNIITWNKFMEELYGVPVSMVLGKRYRELFPFMKEYIEEYQQKALKDETLISEDIPFYVQQTNKSGWISIKFAPLRNSDEQIIGVVMTVNDITARKNVEAEQQKLIRSLRALSACNDALVRAADEDTLLKRICNLIVEYGGFRMAWVGYKLEDEQQGIHVAANAGADAEFITSIPLTWKDEGAGRSAFGEALRSGKISIKNNIREQKVVPAFSEAYARGFAAAISLPLLDNGRVFGVLSIVSADVDAFLGGEVALLDDLANNLAYGILNLRARQAQAEMDFVMHQQNERMQAILKHIPVMINFFDSQANFLWANDCWEQTLGYTLEDGRSGYSFEHSYPDPLKRQEVFDFVRASKSNVWGDFKPYTKDGRWLHTSWINMCLSDGSNIGIGIDLTERKQMELQLVLSEKLASLGTLSAGIAHEINSPLQVITGISETLKERITRKEIEEERLLNQLQVINRNGWRIAEIVRSLLTYARAAPSEMEAYDLNEIVMDTERLMDHQLKTWANIKVEMDLAEGLPPVICNHGQIGQVVIILLTNARDAMPNGGKILISTGVKNRGDDRIFLKITDSGMGIPEEIRNRIFDPFFTTKAEGHGTGLGLSILSGIVRAHGGEIEVESQKGEGTTFTISFLPFPR